eukprot:m.187983 g.187983  ORF g.187983 m.187983 type:complete len:84 (+) comp10021_c1_seq26:162-413(+)
MPSIHTIAILLLVSALVTEAGLISYGICQTGCAAVVVACYAGAGFTFGVPIPGTVPAAILACNAAFGACSKACAAVTLLAPTP